MTLKQQYEAEFNVWRSARHRCSNPNAQSWKNYGGRGIRMCERWANDFAAFLADVGPRPSPRHSIDRVDVNGNYEPGNVRWATRAEQTQNRRNTISDQQVRCVRLLLSQGFARGVIARSLNVSPSIVGRIASGETWKSLGPTGLRLIEEAIGGSR